MKVIFFHYKFKEIKIIRKVKMFILAIQKNKVINNKNYSYQILSLSENFNEIYKLYNSFLDKKVYIMSSNDDSLNFIGMSMRLSDLYFNLNDYKEIIIF